MMAAGALVSDGEHLGDDLVRERAAHEVAHQPAAMEDFANGEREYSEALAQRAVTRIVPVSTRAGAGSSLSRQNGQRLR